MTIRLSKLNYNQKHTDEWHDFPFAESRKSGLKNLESRMLDHRSSVEHKQRRLLKIPRAINCGYVDKKNSVVPLVNKVTIDNDNILCNSEKLEEKASNPFTTETW